MDRIKLPVSTENLDPEQIGIVNLLRRDIMADPTSGAMSVNHRIKTAMCAALRDVEVTTVIDWGCGYHPVRPFLNPEVEYVGVDIDPEVVRENTAAGLTTLLPEQLGWEVDHFNVIISVFAFHFHISSTHIAYMARRIGEKGFILANVYRRTPPSRDKLRDRFAEHGLEVESREDNSGLIARHEFWCITKRGCLVWERGQVLDRVLAHLRHETQLAELGGPAALI